MIMVKLYNHNEDDSVISVFHQHLKKETTTNGFVSEKLNYILRENSLAIIYNGVSHRRSLKH